MDLFLSKLLQIIEFSILPVTQKGVELGDKVFGAAVVDKDSMKAIVASTNREHSSNCPLWHGEMSAIADYFALPENKRRHSNECLFLSTHEPCPMCASAIAWAGFKEVWFLFSYEETSRQFNIPHDLNILHSIFSPCKELNYSNSFYSIYSIKEEAKANAMLDGPIHSLSLKYDKLSEAYQLNKGNNQIPLK